MYSSATTSSSASGFKGGVLLAGFGVGEAPEEGEEGEGDDFGLGERAGFSEGEGARSCNGFTGPVGFRGGAGLAVGVGLGVGEGAAERSESPSQSGSAKMKRRNLMGRLRRATLDDALRVAKNFRMSDHRPRLETDFSL
jgi:hypothetical protein